MSSQPFSSFRQADDFFNVYLHTNDSINTSTQTPRWLINPSSALQDRYKPYKKCIAVVNFVDLPSGTMIATSEGTATKSGLRNPPIKTIFIGLPCGADQCGFN